MEIKKGNRITREFGLTNLALGNRMSVFLILILMTFTGIYSYVNMPKEAFPEIVIPTIYVGTPYAGNSPMDMENLVTRPLEREINNVSGVDAMRSTSQQDYSSILVEFTQDVDISRALQDVKDAVDRAKSDLPTDLDQDPNVGRRLFRETFAVDTYPSLRVGEGDATVRSLPPGDPQGSSP
jgi:multidrug efflux pump